MENTLCLRLVNTHINYYSVKSEREIMSNLIKIKTLRWTKQFVSTRILVRLVTEFV